MNDFKTYVTKALARTEHAIDRVKRRVKERAGLRDPVTILPFIGYGTDESLWIKGRVLEKKGITGGGDKHMLKHLKDMYFRYETDEIPDARVRLSFAGNEQTLTTNQEGFYTADLTAFTAEDLERPWTRVRLELLGPLSEGQHETPAVDQRVLVPSKAARFGVISDIDDTIVHTGATDLFKHVRTVLMNDAGSREVFPGVAAFYQALTGGSDHAEKVSEDVVNPFFYVSSSPWNLFDLFEDFITLHGLPLGPILLKDFGVDDSKLLKTGHIEHKVERIERILKTYPGLDFFLIGDSGQSDPQVFAKVVEHQPERIRAVYLRDVNQAEQDPALQQVASRIVDHQVQCVYMDNCAEAARRAADAGWISQEALARVEHAVRFDSDA